MALSVGGAFAEFSKDVVNLDSEDTKGARKSKDWLREQLGGFDTSGSTFPFAYEEMHIDFGSFERRTKIRPLDDVDLIHCLGANGATYDPFASPITIKTAPGTRLAALCHPESDLLNSRRVINQFVAKLNGISQYADAAERAGSAILLTLSSYDWNFDIVPGFFTAPEWNSRQYYLIPDGNGHWKRTDPRLDRARVATLNQKLNGAVLSVVRLLKYWNRRPTMPSVPSYAFETLLLDHFERRTSVSSYVDFEVRYALEYVAWAIFGSIADAKSIQGNLNTLSVDDRNKISARASVDAQKAQAAWELEKGGNQKDAIARWAEVFGPLFPSYG